MKKFIREMLDDLNRKRLKDAGAARAAVPGDLNNQELSDDPAERVRQLDYQAQKDEERESS
jgi:hypothetical protein